MDVSAVLERVEAPNTIDGADVVPPGFKHTEVGVIPKDWCARRLRDCLRSTPAYGINAPASAYDDRLPTYLRITDISDDGRFEPDPLVSVSHPNARNYYLEAGDLVFARTGASVGKSYLYDEDDGRLVFAGFLIRISADPSRLDPQFLSYYVQTKAYWDWVNLMSARSGQPGINGQEYASLMLPVPDPAEQRAIAAALADVDGVLGALAALIAKKRAIKQAAMQQLLTGRTRLPGFTGEWKRVGSGAIGTFRGGTGFPTRYQGEVTGDYPFLKVSDMNHEGNEVYMTSSSNHVSETIRKRIGATVFPTNSIVFAKVGAAVFLERKRILVRPSCLDNNMAAFSVDSSCADYRFIYYALLNTRFGDLVSTTALPALNGAVLSKIPLSLPSLAEQSAIAAVLSDMDAEIEALDARREKTEAIKQGMMQALLTGRVRLNGEVSGART